MSDFFLAARRLAVSAYKRLPGRPFSKTLARLDGALRRRRSNRTVVVERDGITYELDLRQLIDSQIYYKPAFEADTVAAFERVVRPGMTVIDIGANVGAHALRLARMVGPSGRVYAVEPTLWAYGKLRRNLDLNPEIENVLAERLALSSETRRGAEYCFRSQWGVAEGPMLEESGTVDYLTLDAFCEERGISHVDFIKLDVDGYETKVLAGAAAVLAASRPTLIVEMGAYWQEQAGDSIEALVDLLDAAGYHCLSERGMAPIDDIIAVVRGLEPQGAINVLCVPSGSAPGR